MLQLLALCVAPLGSVLQLHDASGIGTIEFEATATATIKGDILGINSSVPITLTDAATGSACTISAVNGELRTSCPLLAADSITKRTFHFKGAGYETNFPCFDGMGSCHWTMSPQGSRWSHWYFAEPAPSIESCARKCSASDCNAFIFSPRVVGQSEACLRNPDQPVNQCMQFFASNAKWYSWEFFTKSSYARTYWYYYNQRPTNCAEFLYVKEPLVGEYGYSPSEASSGEASSGEPSSGEPSSGQSSSRELASGEPPPDVPGVVNLPSPGVVYDRESGFIASTAHKLRRKLVQMFMGSASAIEPTMPAPGEANRFSIPAKLVA